MDVKNLSVGLFKFLAVLVGVGSTIVVMLNWVYGYTGKVDQALNDNVRQDERLAKLEAFQEKANEAIITTPLKLDTLNKSVTEIRQDMKAYLIDR